MDTPGAIIVAFWIICLLGIIWHIWSRDRGERWDFDKDDVTRWINGKLVARGSYDEKRSHWEAHIYPGLEDRVFHSELEMLKYMKTAPPRPPKPDRTKELKAALKQLKENG